MDKVRFFSFYRWRIMQRNNELEQVRDKRRGFRRLRELPSDNLDKS